MPLVLVVFDYILFLSTAPKPHTAILGFEPGPENRRAADKERENAWTSRIRRRAGPLNRAAR